MSTSAKQWPTEDASVLLAFWFLFPSEETVRAASATLQNEGFTLDPESIGGLGDWRLIAFKQMPLVSGHDLFDSMHVLALQHDGVYLGLEER